MLKSLQHTGAVIISLILFVAAARAQTFQSLFSFDGANGAEPVAGLVQGSDGNFYGTTSIGGANNLGTVFQITPDGELTTLVSFAGSNGAYPHAALLQGSDGNFYGTTTNGGASDSGTVFRMTPAGALSTLVTFDGSNGLRPAAELIQATDGNFYGTTASSIFRMLPSGVLTTLNSTGTLEALVEGTDGNFYGTTATGGDSADGSFFRITPASVFTTLASFHYGQPPNHGPAQPEGVLVQGSDGNFYGTTSVGGSGNPIGRDAGTVYKVTPGGVLTVLVSFRNTNGNGPLAGLVQGSDGNFYGTTYQGGEMDTQNLSAGTIFMMTPTGVLTSLFSFNQVDGAYPNGAGPEAGLVFGSDGNLYGTTTRGGAHDKGTIFKIAFPTLPTPSNLTATPGNGQVFLSWNSSAGAATYTVARRSAATSYADLASEITGATFTDTTATNGTQWFYLVYAMNGDEESGPSNEASATPNAPPSVAITSPAEGASFVAPAQVTLAAQAFDSDGLVQRVDFFRGVTLIGSDTSAPFGVTWSNVAAGNYAITARATDNVGATTTSSPININVIAPTPPAAPTGLTARAVSSSRITLQWTDNATNESGYIIERSKKNKPFKEIARVGANLTEFQDRNLSAGKKYFYRLRAFNTGGDSAHSNTATAKTRP